MRLSAILVFRGRTRLSSEAMGNYASACFGVEPDHGGTTLGDSRNRSPKHVRRDADLDSRILLLQRLHERRAENKCLEWISATASISSTQSPGRARNPHASLHDHCAAPISAIISGKLFLSHDPWCTSPLRLYCKRAYLHACMHAGFRACVHVPIVDDSIKYQLDTDRHVSISPPPPPFSSRNDMRARRDSNSAL